MPDNIFHRALMGSTYTSLHFHIVFSTKERRSFIQPAWRPRLHEYLGGTVRGLGGVADVAGGMEDHVHILADLNATHRLADFMRELKKASSVWAAQHHEREFAWQDGYAAFSVSASHQEALRRYISGQETHHREFVFIDELKRLLEENGVPYDPKYLR
jgi:putative transposase